MGTWQECPKTTDFDCRIGTVYVIGGGVCAPKRSWPEEVIPRRQNALQRVFSDLHSLTERSNCSPSRRVSADTDTSLPVPAVQELTKSGVTLPEVSRRMLRCGNDPQGVDIITRTIERG